MGSGEAIVEIRDLRFLRGERVILNGVDIDIQRGKITAIMGPNGVGKSTLLALIGGQLRPASGRIIVDGQEVHRLRHNRLYRLRKRIGMLFQGGALFTHLDVFENVAFPLREHTRLPEPMIRDLVLMKLEAVGLRGARHLLPAQLSGGMARRVALARAVALDPMMIMYDEPLSGLDPIATGTILRLVRLINDAFGLTSVIVSHEIGAATAIADHLYMFADGKVIEHGTPGTLARSDSPWVQQFMQGLPDGPVPFHYPAPAYAQDLLEGA